MRKIIGLFILIAFIFGIASCKEQESFPEGAGDYQYSIKFNTNGGSPIETINYNTYAEVIKPNDPVLPDATFAGWYTDENLTQAFNFDKPFTLKNYQLYAKWKITISFETNGGNPLNAIEKNANEMVILPIPIDENNRNFVGWYTEKELINKIDGIYTIPNHPVKLYANWARIEEGSKIELKNQLIVNETNHYQMTSNNDYVQLKPTLDKTQWSYCYAAIDTILTDYNVLQVSFKGTKNSYMTVKLEGGNAPAIEQKFIFTGEKQNEFWLIPDANIAQELGQRILIFVEGDKKSNEFDSEVEIYNLAFCKLKTDNEILEESIIFDTMGGNPLAPINAPLGSSINLEEIPTKAGYKFDGWYQDKTYTKAFTETKMPKGPTTLYAKWTLADTYQVSFVTNAYIEIAPINVRVGLPIEIAKPEVPGWEFVGWYTDEALTHQSDLIMQAENIILYAKWKTLADLSDQNNSYSLLKGWTTPESNAYQIVENNNGLSLTATPQKAEFSYIAYDLASYDLKYINALHLQFSGKIGQSFVIKYNNDKEIKITIKDNNQEEWLYLETPINPANKLLIFYALNESLTENETIVFSKLELLEPIQKLDHFNILKGWFSNQDGHYIVTENANNTVITSTTEKTKWSFVKINLNELVDFDAKNALRMELELIGPKNHQLIIKYNNSKELKVILTGELQAISINFDIPLNLSINNHLIMFIDGHEVQSEDLSITFNKYTIISKYQEIKDNVSYEYEEVDILKGWFEADEESYTIIENPTNTTITATENKKTWSVVKYLLTDLTYTDLYSAKIHLQGPKNHTVIFKYNNAIEQKIVLDGTLQEIEVIFTSPIDKSKPLYFFIDGGKTLESEVTVVFEKISLVRQIEVEGGEPVVKEYAEISLLKGWFEADSGSYKIVENTDNTVITAIEGKKTWSVAKLLINDLNINNTVSFKLTLNGPKDHTVIFKYNNAIEQKIVLTGEKQVVEVQVTVPLDTSKALYIFIDGGKTITEEVGVEFSQITAVVEK